MQFMNSEINRDLLLNFDEKSPDFLKKNSFYFNNFFESKMSENNNDEKKKSIGNFNFDSNMNKNRSISFQKTNSFQITQNLVISLK